MKRLFFALLLCPLFCNAQRYRNDVLDISEDTIKSTYWQVLQHSTVNNAMNTFFRVLNIKDSYSLELKVSLGNASFIVPAGTGLDLELSNHRYITLHNKDYQKSCKGCGANKYAKNDIDGATLVFPINAADLEILKHNYLQVIRLHLDEGIATAVINTHRSDSFMDTFRFLYEASQYKSNSIY